MLTRFGFAPLQVFTRFRASVACPMERFSRAWGKQKQQDRILPELTLLQLSKVSFTPVQTLLSRHFAGTRRGLVPDPRTLDRQLSAVALWGQQVVGVLLASVQPDRIVLPCLVVEREFRKQAVTVGICREALVQITAGGHTTLGGITEEEQSRAMARIWRRSDAEELGRLTIFGLDF